MTTFLPGLAATAWAVTSGGVVLMMNKGFLALSTVGLLAAGAGTGVLTFEHSGQDKARAGLLSVAEEFCAGDKAEFHAPPDPGTDIEAIIAGMENIARQQKAIAVCRRAKMELYAYDLAGTDLTSAQN
jgi:hypothetical protein